jgi:hypothetical protein
LVSSDTTESRPAGFLGDDIEKEARLLQEGREKREGVLRGDRVKQVGVLRGGREKLFEATERTSK